jgi:hypothetical protein
MQSCSALFAKRANFISKQRLLTAVSFNFASLLLQYKFLICLYIGLGNLDAFFGRFSRLFLDYFQVKFILFLDGLVKN